MKIPRKVKVFAHTYSIKIDPLLSIESGTTGRCCSNTLKIELDPNVPESNQADTFLHEIMEALKYQLQLDLEHAALSQIATGVLTVIRDNNLDFRIPQ